jgi:hypothetical protein
MSNDVSDKDKLIVRTYSKRKNEISLKYLFTRRTVGNVG